LAIYDARTGRLKNLEKYAVYLGGAREPRKNIAPRFRRDFAGGGCPIQDFSRPKTLVIFHASTGRLKNLEKYGMHCIGARGPRKNIAPRFRRGFAGGGCPIQDFSGPKTLVIFHASTGRLKNLEKYGMHCIGARGPRKNIAPRFRRGFAGGGCPIQDFSGPKTLVIFHASTGRLKNLEKYGMHCIGARGPRKNIAPRFRRGFTRGGCPCRP